MIEIRDVYKEFSNERINFSNIKFEDNKSYVILGPSGCGKSTLLNIISGNIKADGGTITIDIDNSIYNLEKLSSEELQKYRRDNISYVSQEFNLFNDFTVKDNLKLIEKVKGKRISIEEALDVVSLKNKVNQKVKTLSGGEKQRVCIARALLQEGKILLCDEPTGSLNQALANDIIKSLIDVHKKNKNMLIVVTHDDRLIENFDCVIKYDDFIKMNIGGAN
ncbi:ABC transporter ATP-binding protein [Clostridium sp. NSJ-145]|uniref:ABC transporter ATP-binding protein n=1 Tax=Clostridium sp. NSJ-145 TaxID=2897777 RepID=UPI001E5A66F7|nr:ABC transporter ATP-binding protein [Clostridium sp. NSJ-145]MCD2500603.1 ABC transporter ATP-binding protein [Clostridium sp. NSJ-145]